MEFHPRSSNSGSTNYLAIRKDLYGNCTSVTGRFYRTKISSLSKTTLSPGAGVTYQSQNDSRLQHLLSTSERERYEAFGSGQLERLVATHDGRREIVAACDRRSENAAICDRGHADCFDEDTNTEDDEENPRLFIDHPSMEEIKYNNNCQEQDFVGANTCQEPGFGSALECHDCGQIFTSKSLLARHVKAHSPLTTTTSTVPASSSSINLTSPQAWPIHCSTCNLSFERRQDLKVHEQSPAHHHAMSSSSTHANSSSTVNSTSDGSKTIYECDQPGCLRHYTSYSSFMKHRKTHAVAANDLNPQNVTTCGAISPTDGKRHSGEKKFQCSQCSKRFPTSKDLKRHDVVHTGNREFQCSFCSHRFGRKDHRMRHEKKTHAAELSPPPQQHPLNPMTQHFSHKSSPPHPTPPSPSRHIPSPVLVQHQDQLVVQRQPQWYRRALTPPPPSPQGLKMEQYMDTIDEDGDLSPLMEDADSMTERKPLDLQKNIDVTSGSSNGTVPLDEMTLTSEDAEDECSDEVKSGLDWIISEFISDEDLPKRDSNNSSCGFYSPEIKPEPGPDPYQVPAPSLVPAAAAPVPNPGQTKTEDLVFGDFMTRTKNPVLPSVYVDNSQPLIVPEPSKQRYHNSPRSLLFEEDDFMADVDVFLREKDIFSNI